MNYNGTDPRVAQAEAKRWSEADRGVSIHVWRTKDGKFNIGTRRPQDAEGHSAEYRNGYSVPQLEYMH